MTAHARPLREKRGAPALSTVILLLGVISALAPLAWLGVASTKTGTELFSTGAFELGGSLLTNLSAVFAYDGGVFGWWLFNSLVYAGGGALLSMLVSAAAGYGFAIYRFRGRNVLFGVIVGAILIPGIVLALPQYFLFAQFGWTDSYWSVLVPVLVSPFGIFLCRIYAEAAIPFELIESARLDGAGELRIFASIGMRMMAPGLVTVFLLQFIGIWNNFLLPYLMLSSAERFPVTVGLYQILNRSTTEEPLWHLVVMGSLITIVLVSAVVLVLQRYWRLDLISGSVKG